MNDTADLRAQYASLRREARAITKAAYTAKRELTPGELQRLGELEAQLDRIEDHLQPGATRSTFAALVRPTQKGTAMTDNATSLDAFLRRGSGNGRVRYTAQEQRTLVTVR